MITLKHSVLSVAAAFGLYGLGGCGFTPLYAVKGVMPKLASIEVSRPDGRTGYLLGQDLDDQFGKENRASPPVYRLLLKTREVRIPRGIRVDNVASRYEVQLATTYTLVEIKTREVVTKGLVQVNVTYDSADQPYAGVAAELDGQKRAAEQAAERIRLELSTYFASPRPAVAASTIASDVGLNTYSERLQPATVQSPRERALGQPTSELGAPSIVGQPLQTTTPEGAAPGPSAPLTDPFSPSTDPNNAPGAPVAAPAAN
jgi:LPS-assembly lipoprotein